MLLLGTNILARRTTNNNKEVPLYGIKPKDRNTTWIRAYATQNIDSRLIAAYKLLGLDFK